MGVEGGLRYVTPGCVVLDMVMMEIGWSNLEVWIVYGEGPASDSIHEGILRKAGKEK